MTSVTQDQLAIGRPNHGSQFSRVDGHGSPGRMETSLRRIFLPLTLVGGVAACLVASTTLVGGDEKESAEPSTEGQTGSLGKFEVNQGHGEIGRAHV